jgi:long-subunit fatty acid transport protein
MTLIFPILISAVLASPAEFYGFGGTSIGQGGGGVAQVSDTSAAFLNPAGLSNLHQPELLFGASFVRFSTPSLPGLYWDTNRDGIISSADAPLEVDSTPDPADGGMMGFSTPILDRYHIAGALFLPTAHLTRFQTFDPTIPTYFMMENRLHRYAMALAGSVELPKGVSIGGGARMLIRAPLALNFTLSTAISGEGASNGDEDFVSAEIDVHAIDLRIEADMVPTFGIQWDVGEVISSLDGLRFGASGRGEASMDIDVYMDGQINAELVDVGDLESTTLALVYASKIHVLDHFLPAQLQAGAAYSPVEALDIYLDGQFTHWSGMELNIAQISEAILEATLADLAASSITDGNQLDVHFRDTFSLKIGVSLRFPEWDLGGRLGRLQLIPRGGFGYEPSPLVAQSPESALLDSDRLIFALGLGAAHHFEAFGDSRSMEWDLFFQKHKLASGPLPRPESEEPKLGYPVDGGSIPIGGGVTVLGIQTRYQY